MATTKPDADKAEEKKQSFLKSKKMIIAVVVLLAAGGGAYETVLKPAPKAAAVAKPQPGDTVTIPAMIVNLQDSHYLKLALAVRLIEGKGTAADFKTPQAAQLVINEFADLPLASVSTSARRQLLLTDLTKKLNKAYENEVYDVLLTQFMTT